MKSLSFNSIKLSVVTKLETSSRHKRTKIEYNEGTGSDGKLMSLNIFKILYPKTIMDNLARYNKQIM